MPYPIKWFKSKQNKCRQYYTNFSPLWQKVDNFVFWRTDAKKLLTITLTITFIVQTINITISHNFSSSVLQMLKRHFGGLMPCLKIFWAGPNFLCKTKIPLTYCADTKLFVIDQKMISIFQFLWKQKDCLDQR